MLYDDNGDVYSSVGGCCLGWVMLDADVEKSSCAGACLGLGEKGPVAVDGENHGAGQEAC
jgi:hypothetical protein